LAVVVEWRWWSSSGAAVDWCLQGRGGWWQWRTSGGSGGVAVERGAGIVVAVAVEMVVEVARLVVVAGDRAMATATAAVRAQTTINQIWTKINYIVSFPN
jgi:hypothetical protein